MSIAAFTRGSCNKRSTQSIHIFKERRPSVTGQDRISSTDQKRIENLEGASHKDRGFPIYIRALLVQQPQNQRQIIGWVNSEVQGRLTQIVLVIDTSRLASTNRHSPVQVINSKENTLYTPTPRYHLSLAAACGSYRPVGCVYVGGMVW